MTKKEIVKKLYENYSAGLFEYALTLTMSYTDAEDVIQDVFVRMINKPPKADVESYGAYLRTAVRNKCYDCMKRKRRNLLRLFDFSGKSVLEPIYQTIDSADRAILIEKSLAKLPIVQREVVYLKIYREMSFAEIADFLEESINTVTSRYRYATARLKSMLKAKRQDLFNE